VMPALRAIYRAADAEAGRQALEAFEAGPWGQKYPAIALSWRRNWEHVVPFFAFPEGVRRIIYTTNAIEALNSKLRRAVRTRGHFPNDDAAMKLLSGSRSPGRRMETAATRMVRGQDPVRRRLRR
jgi:putative transposase